MPEEVRLLQGLGRFAVLFIYAIKLTFLQLNSFHLPLCGWSYSFLMWMGAWSPQNTCVRGNYRSLFPLAMAAAAENLMDDILKCE